MSSFDNLWVLHPNKISSVQYHKGYHLPTLPPTALPWSLLNETCGWVILFICMSHQLVTFHFKLAPTTAFQIVLTGCTHSMQCSLWVWHEASGLACISCLVTFSTKLKTMVMAMMATGCDKTNFSVLCFLKSKRLKDPQYLSNLKCSYVLMRFSEKLDSHYSGYWFLLRKFSFHSAIPREEDHMEQSLQLHSVKAV